MSLPAPIEQRPDPPPAPPPTPTEVRFDRLIAMFDRINRALVSVQCDTTRLCAAMEAWREHVKRLCERLNRERERQGDDTD